MQSFSYKAKAELCRGTVQRLCCARAECYGALLYCNTFTMQEVRIITENPEFAARLPRLFQRAFNVKFDRLPSDDLPGGKLIDDGVERIQIKAAFGSELEVFLEAVGKNDIKHPRVPHSWHPEKKRSAYTFLGVLSSRHTRSARLPFLHWDSPE